jgi:hypothetical protein
MQPKRSEAKLAEFGASACSKHSAGMLAWSHFVDTEERRAKSKVMVILQTVVMARLPRNALRSTLGNVPADRLFPGAVQNSLVRRLSYSTVTP